MRRREAAERAADGPRAPHRRRALVVAAVVAAIVGFGGGWLVRLWLDRTPASAAHEASETVRERVREQTR